MTAGTSRKPRSKPVNLPLLESLARHNIPLSEMGSRFGISDSNFATMVLTRRALRDAYERGREAARTARPA